MEMRPYVDELCHEFMDAAAGGGDDTRALAERLVGPLEKATRLTLLKALSAAADEITRDLAPGSVDVRLRGLDPNFVVTLPPADEPYDGEGEGDYEFAAGGTSAPRPAASAVGDVAGGTARINFRPPEHLKVLIDEAASKQGLSVNAWLVRACNAVLASESHRGERRAPRGGQRHSGWVR
ncbi:hypothetical protein JK364_52390 [Streptomyces sp. 110]|uniref:Toxin-antitoxin system HicB family antitoxin n=1 Tax=Streptomyces endocoffeicus TaxID=2898945 RepID=A0ABS1Q7Z7_9ACTN|nr:hypothetical protein [Streptomyces endocoffeicus]MBL1120803.1 hypothetical protein [Streptomyces endocoffeicus]